MNNQIVSSIRGRNVVEFYYKGLFRTVVFFTYGISTTGKEVVSGYQISGQHERGELPDWKLFTTDKIEGMKILDQVYNDIPNGYVRNDSRMSSIYYEV